MSKCCGQNMNNLMSQFNSIRNVRPLSYSIQQTTYNKSDIHITQTTQHTILNKLIHKR